MIRAAGGLVVRPGPHGSEVLVVHRPRYRDWSFPKGKARPDETDEACALREVEEETGLRCELRQELSTTRYTDAKGRSKKVRYWSMYQVGGRLKFLNEVDDARWVSPNEARGILTYDRDISVLECLERT